jgi:hypothetical protein
MQIFIFNCNSQRLRRYSSGVIYANSYPNTVFKFNFNTPDWDLVPTKTAVFSCHGKNHTETLDENNICKVPAEVLHEGYFLVSVEGLDMPTNKVRIPVVPIPEEIQPDNPNGGDCNCGPNMVYVPVIDDQKILSWIVQEATENMPVPAPVDLDASDEWVEDDAESEYIWEEE